MPAVAKPAAVALPDNRSNVDIYLDEVAPVSIVGRLIKFDVKAAKYVTVDDDVAIDANAEFIALCDETLVGWIKFYNDGETKPEKHMGLLYDQDFRMLPREELGDLDPSEWPIGPSGQPEDPWKHQQCLVLQHTDTNEMYTFATTSDTGRRAVGNLLRHFKRMQRINANELPVIRLGAGGFLSKKPGVGYVNVPVFVIRGRTPRDSAAKPDTSLAADMNDELPAHVRA